jgi:hypothetical protein
MPDGSLILRPDTSLSGFVDVVALPNPFKMGDRIEFRLPQGKTLEELFCKVQPSSSLRHFAAIFIEDEEIHPDLWHCVRPKSGVRVTIRALMQGGGGGGGGGKSAIIAIVAIVAVAVIAPYVAAWAGQAVSAGGLGLSTAAANAVGGAVAGLAGAAIAAIGSALVGTPSAPSLAFDLRRSPEESPTFSISSARNRVARFSPIPVVLGTHKAVPPYGAAPYTEVVGDDQYLRFVVVWGYGPVSVSDIKIGNTAIENFEDVEVEDDFTGTLDSLTLYPQDAEQEDLSLLLDTDFQTRTTATDVDELGITISWPQGLVRFSNQGVRQNHSVTVTAEYKISTDVSWTPWFETTYTDNTAEVKRVAVRLSGLSRDTYDVRLKVDANSDDQQIRDTTFWAALRSFKNNDPIQKAGIAKSAYRIRASDQLNGIVDELNAIVSLLIPTWTGSGWTVFTSASSNPAAIFRYVLTGVPNDKALDSAQVDDGNLGAWYEFCETNSLTYNSVIDYRTSVRDLLQDIASAGRATPRIVDDQWGVIVDEPRTTIAQHFTPRNTRGFRGRVDFIETPHAYRVRFLNEDKGYREDERIVYDDGFDATNATRFEVLQLAGQTNADNIYKLTRYYLASIRLRPEHFTFATDIEHLVCTRGDLVRFNHDVPKIGLSYGRIKSISSNDLTLDEPVVMALGTSYSIRVRQPDGTSNVQTVVTASGEQFTITVASATGMSVGDLFEFGETGTESLQLLVASIDPSDDLEATIECVPYSQAVYNAANTIPAYTSLLSEPVSRSFTGPPAPVITNVVSDENALRRSADGGVQVGVEVYFSPGAAGDPLNGGTTKTVEYRTRFRLTNGPGRWMYSARVESDARSIYLTPVEQSEAYDIEVQAIDAFGGVSNSTRVSEHVVIGATAPPTDITSFTMNTVGPHSYLEWAYTPPLDVTHYEIRYHPNQSNTSWNTMTALASEVPSQARSYTIPSRSGSYAIKAVDFLGIKSVNALYINASLEDPEAQNVVQTTTENPTFSGTKTDTIVADGALQLGSAEVMADWPFLSDVISLTYGVSGGFEPEGFYEFGEVDLSEVYTSRVTVDVDAGLVSLIGTMNSWATLAEISTLSGGATGDGQAVEMQVNSSIVDSGTPVYQGWRTFAVGDYTARHIKFRAKLTTAQIGVSPKISSLTATIDMPDRVADAEDVASGAGTKSITFSPSFRVLRSLSITAQNMQTGDYYEVASKTRAGFDVTFRNSSGTAVDRTFDWQAIGYGRERAT